MGKVAFEIDTKEALLRVFELFGNVTMQSVQDYIDTLKHEVKIGFASEEEQSKYIEQAKALYFKCTM